MTASVPLLKVDHSIKSVAKGSQVVKLRIEREPGL